MASPADLGETLSNARTIDGALSIAAAAVVSAAWTAMSGGMARLVADNPAAVHEVLGPLADLAGLTDLPATVTAAVLSDEVEALVVLGDLDGAEARVRSLEELQATEGWPLVLTLRSRALVLSARGQLAPAEQAALQAVAACGGLVDPLAAGRTCLVAGSIARRNKHKSSAAELLDRATRLFDEVGCEPMRERAAQETARLGRAPSGTLTATESQVAALSAAGHTNRSVASRLGISPKTVEANVTRIYRKLGIHSRAELGALFSRGGALEAQTP